MGKLALWGAVSGGAEAAGEHIKEKETREAEAAAADIDHKREMALERLRQRSATERTGMQQTGATERTGMQIDAQRDIAGLEQEGAMSRVEREGEIRSDLQSSEQAWMAEENQLDRESRERIARYTSGVSSAAARAARERFKPKILTVTEANEQYPGLSMEKDTPAIYDEMAGTWYIQQGDKYVLPDTKPAQIARAPQAAVQHLFENPQLATEFIKPRDQGGYGYLPLGFMQALRAAEYSAPSNQE